MSSRKLKVFQAQFGFYDSVVAATSQSAALRAWGTRQNLFASGEAKVTTDDAAVAAATAHPETPLRRAVGSTDPFALEPTSLPKVPDVPTKRRARTVVTANPAPPPERSRPDRSKLDAAEKALGQLDDSRTREEAEFRREEEVLEIRKTEAQTVYVDAHKAATVKVADARNAYRQADGGV